VADSLLHFVRRPLGAQEFADIGALTVLHPCGAVNAFYGVARPDVVGGRRVTALEYEAFESMAEREIRSLLDAARSHWPLAWAFVRHSLGRVRAGEISVAVAVGTPHRSEAYAASRYLIEGIKHEVPVWKKERFEDGSARWALCTHVGSGLAHV
jgi:molybdopterin synthase catalytic subunit